MMVSRIAHHAIGRDHRNHLQSDLSFLILIAYFSLLEVLPG